jgi:hypothetical protein
MSRAKEKERKVLENTTQIHLIEFSTRLLDAMQITDFKLNRTSSVSS